MCTIYRCMVHRPKIGLVNQPPRRDADAASMPPSSPIYVSFIREFGDVDESALVVGGELIYRWNRHTASSGFWRPQLPLVLKSGRRRG